jgi:tetratricopeptide (TPR) repeat protein
MQESCASPASTSSAVSSHVATVRSRTKPGSAALAQLDLGVSLARSGNYDEAAAAFRRALDVDPLSLAARFNLGLTFAARGQLDAAIEVFRDALRIAPDLAQLHFSLGAALKRQGRLEEAILSYERAAVLQPSLATFNDLGSALRERGRTDEAVAAFRRALQIDPSAALVHLNLGTALEDKQQLEDATRSYERALALDPELMPAHRSLAMVLVERDLVDQGFARFRHYARLGHAATEMKAMRGSAPALKRQHDRDQADYLMATGGDGRRAHQRPAPMKSASEPPGFQIADGGRLSEPALNPANDTARIETAWAAANPKIVVIDDLVTLPALENLRRFCWSSTIWNSVYPDGYLGAFPEDGFAPALLAQVSEELRARFPAIFRRLPLKLWWAFKCDTGALGIGIHADFAAVNVNFWITPDEANLDAASGGLRIWNVPAPLGWDYQKYNANFELIREFLSRANAGSVIVPYRSNRAVIFDSNLFHETHQPRFKDGYLNRRINITLLYGMRENAHEGGGAPQANP